MLWDSRLWRGEIMEIGSYTLTCKFEALLQDYKCHITGVYAPNCRIEREHTWEEIGAVRGLFEGPWAVCGDFNVTRLPSEKKNCRRRTPAMVDFSYFIEDVDLLDLQLEGESFISFKGDNNNVASRIDRI
ncbi:unnamed protein product [Withania somnifera]